jgi:hypothetical protein
MTYAELKTAIANYLNRSDLTSQLDTFIDNTEAELNRRLRVKDMVTRSNITVDAQYEDLPTDFLELINLDLQTSNPKPLFQQSLESLDVYRRANNDIIGQPVYFSLSDKQIEFAPKPDASYTAQITYYARITGLSDSNTTNFVSNNYSDVYLYGCLKHASIYLMEDERVPLFHEYFEKSLEEMRQEQEKAEFGKGSLIPRRRTYGKPKKHIYYWSNN